MTLPALDAEDFPDYFRAVHGHDPFPWQHRLLREVLTQGWTRPISVPTASGKTAVLDIAVFALACQAGLPATERTAPRRIALVVDRRIVVDGAYDRAKKIHARIAAKTDGDEHPSAVLATVHMRLLAHGGDVPLAIALLRGGIYREDRWARSPAQPVILCSTVDQVGSRLLFRGYGLSNHAWPIHAGLLGNDTLIVLDEAHCSRPFQQTLEWVAKYRCVAETPITAPFAAVAMTATLPDGVEPFCLDDADRQHPLLKRRLSASKTMHLQESGKSDDEFAKKMADLILPAGITGSTILAVVNRVAAAREIHRRLDERTRDKKNPLAATVILLTGRSRSVERDVLLRDHASRLMAGRNRVHVKDQPALIVIATQCVEVGADLDVDALITECCPLDALRQRLGRLDRLGLLGSSTAVVVCRGDQVWDGAGEPPEDAIYGTALARTWLWLTQQRSQNETGLDGGIDGLAKLLPVGDELAQLNAPPVDAPIIFPAYCDLWAQTGPEPAVSPDPAIFLHGPKQGEPEVQVVWRGDLLLAETGNPDEEVWRDTIAACPPVAGEALSLPLSAARRWLAGELTKNDIVADTDTQAGDDPEKSMRPALRWRGPDDSALALTAQDIRPGDLLVVPCSYGGCDGFGWNPQSCMTADLADRARRMARRALVLRLHPALATSEWPAAWHALANVRVDPENGLPELDELDEQCTQALSAQPLWAALARDGRRELLPHPSGTGLILIGHAGWSEEAGDFTDEDDSSCRAPKPLPLLQHLGDVETFARRFAQALGLPSALIQDLALAGKLHDLGKADPRFQAWLCGGDRVKSRQIERKHGLLAKSHGVTSGRSQRQARERSGYPMGARHELLSVTMAESCDAFKAMALDWDLVRHLVASHHGRCRPWAPVIHDERPVAVAWTLDGHLVQASSATALERLDSGVAERFWTLTRRYGWWGLAGLETCLRLADHRASEAAENGELS